MPKIVDHEKQRRIVAEAALRVIQDSGLEHATVRKIAAEAKVSAGALRHYFATQAELLVFCMNEFRARIERRLESIDIASEPPLIAFRNLLLQFIPLDAERKMEMEVWLTFTSKTFVYPELKQLSAQMDDSLYAVSDYVIRALARKEGTQLSWDPGTETDKLHALVDGLALHRMLRPERLGQERIERMLDQHLASLYRGDPSGESL
ncbi:TetR/AcrR family transcriptional regulator [Cohnella boryungensis]|uniref:TetR/AcrR family transcriptional regulator n=1 Tax=Cohnella boryungensis TaxID=768479 RepID=A0ABV8S4T1_9BACL